MKIMELLYKEWDEYRRWQVGEQYTKYVRGVVHSIQLNEDGSVTLFVLPDDGSPAKIATWFPPHAVQRVYYGEE